MPPRSIHHSESILRIGRMNTLVTFAVLVLAGLACSNPVAKKSLTVTEKLFPSELSVYTSKNDIVKVFVPLNSLNFDSKTDIDITDENKFYVFFVEAEKTTDGKLNYKGLYVLKDKVATKVLDTGRDAAATSDDSEAVYFAGQDGLYVFDSKTNKAEKYGTLTDDFIGLEKSKGTNGFYALTADYKVFKINQEGTVKEEITKIKDARQIVLDNEGNLFYVDGTYNIYVYFNGEATKVTGLPESTYVELLRPPFVQEKNIPAVVGNEMYVLHADGKTEDMHVTFDVKVSAYSMESLLVQYYAYNKNIYEFNLLAILLNAVELEEFKTFFVDKTEKLQTIATNAKITYRAPTKGN